ncbi:dTDP-4-dehydrorhamnose reductase [Burkholderia sp. WAC0059]|uniref:dTDP-4-dehydrorhamnose reductase n=1 Tax=Burkholderia sp. WAC0059 TaxID=2066022 RepID=UPI000C7F0E31|nr:dTDP-4-dehydrorhamnose reductase [Burkholderia sp. WAC0059]PLZ03213.1 dTDP-4-dehydrorhamnose reductase [Burkholderia sp. WAC0059]
MSDSFSSHQPWPVIMLTGANGQVGFELTRSLQGLGRVVALDRNALNIGDADRVRAIIRDVKPALIINAAAYTAVDRAETDELHAHLANGVAPGTIAEEARRLGALVIHYSTDYVFDGTSAQPYREGDEPKPLNVYGRTKLAGERAVAAANGAHLILRTSWVYSVMGRNFLLTMLRLARERRDEIRVVADQVGAPTWSGTIAALTSHIVARYIADPDADRWGSLSGIYHLSAAGEASWFDFATAIFDATNCKGIAVRPISSSEYPTPARRPLNSRLCNDKLASTFGLRAPAWREALARCLHDRDRAMG